MYDALCGTRPCSTRSTASGRAVSRPARRRSAGSAASGRAVSRSARRPGTATGAPRPLGPGDALAPPPSLLPRETEAAPTRLAAAGVATSLLPRETEAVCLCRVASRMPSVSAVHGQGARHDGRARPGAVLQREEEAPLGPVTALGCARRPCCHGGRAQTSWPRPGLHAAKPATGRRSRPRPAVPAMPATARPQPIPSPDLLAAASP